MIRMVTLAQVAKQKPALVSPYAMAAAFRGVQTKVLGYFELRDNFIQDNLNKEHKMRYSLFCSDCYKFENF